MSFLVVELSLSRRLGWRVPLAHCDPPRRPFMGSRPCDRLAGTGAIWGLRLPSPNGNSSQWTTKGAASPGFGEHVISSARRLYGYCPAVPVAAAASAIIVPGTHFAPARTGWVAEKRRSSWPPVRDCDAPRQWGRDGDRPALYPAPARHTKPGFENAVAACMPDYGAYPHVLAHKEVKRVSGFWSSREGCSWSCAQRGREGARRRWKARARRPHVPNGRGLGPAPYLTMRRRWAPSWFLRPRGLPVRRAGDLGRIPNPGLERRWPVGDCLWASAMTPLREFG